LGDPRTIQAAAAFGLLVSDHQGKIRRILIDPLQGFIIGRTDAGEGANLAYRGVIRARCKATLFMG